MVPKRKLTTDDLFQQQQEQKLDELQEKAQLRLLKSQRFRARVKKLTGQRLTPSEQDLVDTPDPDDEPEEKINGHHGANGNGK